MLTSSMPRSIIDKNLLEYGLPRVMKKVISRLDLKTKKLYSIFCLQFKSIPTGP